MELAAAEQDKIGGGLEFKGGIFQPPVAIESFQQHVQITGTGLLPAGSGIPHPEPYPNRRTLHHQMHIRAEGVGR